MPRILEFAVHCYNGTVNIRLIWAIISNILEEAAIAAIVIWGLPRLGVRLPLWGLLIIMAVWLVYSILTYQKGTRALLQKPVKGMTDMVGSRGVVVSALSPGSMVKIKGELWDARPESGGLEVGEEVEVVVQEGLKLVVKKLEPKVKS